MKTKSKKRRKRKGRARSVVFILLITVLILGVVYVCISLQYRDRFYDGTWINGEDVSGKTVDEVKESLTQEHSSYKLTITLPDGENQEIIYGDEIDYAVTYDSVEDIKEEQGMWTWFMGYNGEHSYTAQGVLTFDEDAVTKIVEAFDCVTGVDAVAPTDASIEFTDEGPVLIEETVGTLVDAEVILPLIQEALAAEESSLILDESCYVQPSVTTESEEIQEVLTQIEAIEAVVITYTIGDYEEVLDSSTTTSWICQDEDGNVTVDTDSVYSYVQSLANTYDTVGNSREFVTSNGETVTVPGGTYGWAINVDTEASELTALLLAGESQTREPTYSSTAAMHSGNEIGDTYIEISIEDQHMWFYLDGELYVDTNVVTGNVSKEYDTPTGSYKVISRYKDITLTGENADGSEYESDVEYWIGFYGSGYGIHDASWRGDTQDTYGGTIYLTNGSHGCVNTPLSWIEQIYEAVTIGTPVLIY